MNSSSYSLSGKPKYRVRIVLQALYHRSRKAIAIKLACEFSNAAKDNWLTISMKWIGNLFLVYFPLLYGLRIVQRYCSDTPYYPFKDEIVQTTTRVIFTRSKRSTLQICLKFWQRTKDEVCDDRLIVRSDEYLIEGLEFNRKFAPGVYLGIAKVIVSDDKKRIQRGPLMKHPLKEELMDGERYALVMRTLKKDQGVDYQLVNGKVSVDFLAHEIAHMHSQLEQSLESNIYGKSDRIADKSRLNNELFLDAMNELFPAGYKIYAWIGACLKEACSIYASHFERRCMEGHIKRCHGDLKVTNLWVRSSPVPFRQSKLLALDCIDFKPEFCYIDTLSDVAMLAVDLERLYPQDTELAYHFLQPYLNEMQENVEQVKPLLEYYMTEKAIVCSYVSILFDDQQGKLGKQYLEIAVRHARCLRKLVEHEKQLIYSN